MGQLLERIKKESAALVPPVLFFFVALHLVAFVRVLMLKGSGITLETSTSVTIASLVLGKAVLIADLLPFINRFPEKPLVYNVAWKTTIYFLIAMLFHYLERLIDHWQGGGGFAGANDHLLAEIVWPHFWAIQIFLLVMILNYCIAREFVRAVGGSVVRRMFFGPLKPARNL
jgi:hypothetical protein